eukprot:UN33999
MNRTTVLWDEHKRNVLDEEHVETVFSQDIEHYTLKIDHQWQVWKFHNEDEHSYDGANYDMYGVLKNKDGDTIKEFPKHSYDIVRLQEILEAGDIDLDEPSDSDQSEGNESMRYTGITVLITIEYSQRTD